MLQKNRDIEDKIQVLLFVGLSFFVLSYPLPRYIWPYYVLGNQIQEIFLIVLMVYFILVLTMKYRMETIPYKRVITYYLLGMILCGLISCILCGDITNSVYGDEFQAECYLVMLSYYTIFLAAAHMKNKVYRNKLMYFIILVLLFIIIYGVLQYFQVPFMFYNTATKAAVLPTRNQNYYAAFPVLFLGIVFGLLFHEEKKNKKFCYHLLSVLGFAAGICSDSMVFYAGIFFQFLLFLFLLCFQKRKRLGTFILLVVEFFLVMALINNVSNGQVEEEITSLSSQIKAEGSLFGDTVGTKRMKIWKTTIKAIPKNWVFGCGIECSYANHGIYNAHNEYLHIWAEQGTFAIVFYIAFLFSLFIPGVFQYIKEEKYEFDMVSKISLFSFLGYLAQAFGNIRTVQVAPYFWLFCGLLYVRKNNKEGNQKKKHIIESEKNIEKI